MRARGLKHKVIFQEKTNTKNDFGEKIEEHTDVLTTKVSIQTITGKETFLSSKDYSTLTHKLRARYTDKINSNQSIKFGTRTFNILAVLNIFEANKELEILVKEVL